MRLIQFTLLILAFMSQAFPNDKGNLDTFSRTNLSLDSIMELGARVHEVTYPALSSKKLEIENGLIKIKAVTALASAKVSDVGLIDLKEISNVHEVNDKLKPFVTLVTSLIAMNEWELLSDVVTGDYLFYHAFDLKEAKQSVEFSGLDLKSKSIMLNKITSINQSFWQALKDEIISSSGKGAWDRFSSQLDNEKLGMSH